MHIIVEKFLKFERFLAWKSWAESLAGHETNKYIHVTPELKGPSTSDS